MTEDARANEDFFRRRYGREALYLPSGRAALYLAFREWLRSGDRLLMSPVNDDVVFFVVLAAGLVPVLGPVDPRTGNLDVAAIDDSRGRTRHTALRTPLRQGHTLSWRHSCSRLCSLGGLEPTP